ncbi:hypothetical protein [Fodinicurvata fenggangensis]|uniref:hypothetical protein n=1 Tax=Fodinicurvata fenggangensis TaxID=1121830 RepID=UPI0012DF420F|nr:hypothetical protein [Fodinicurvata fenggangensis]
MAVFLSRFNLAGHFRPGCSFIYARIVPTAEIHYFYWKNNLLGRGKFFSNDELAGMFPGEAAKISPKRDALHGSLTILLHSLKPRPTACEP